MSATTRICKVCKAVETPPYARSRMACGHNTWWLVEDEHEPLPEEMDIKAYFHMGKGYLWEQEILDREQFDPEVANELNYFGYEHGFTARVNTKTGKYKIIEIDGRKVEE